MGLFGKKTKRENAPGNLAARWQEAYRANPRVYEKDGRVVVGLALTETADSLFPLAVEKQWAIKDKAVDVWFISMVSLTRDSVIGTMEYQEAMKRLKPYFLAEKGGWVLIRGLTDGELEALFEGLPRNVI